MAVPKTVLWHRDPHTAAKHTLLRRYMDAWFPIMANQFRSEGITFLDGFAGPGEYLNSKESSPQIVMSQAHRNEVVAANTTIRLVFIEQMKRRADHLADLLVEDFPYSRRPRNLKVEVETGNCNQLHRDVLRRVGALGAPIFANLDGWGVDTDYGVVATIAECQSSEVLVTFADQFFTRFADVEDIAAGDRVFGCSDWRSVSDRTSDAKKPFLLELYRSRLFEAGFDHVLMFEMVDEGGHTLYQFFGTTSTKAVEKFKDGLWEVDGVAGQRFRDPRVPGQMSIDVLEPNYKPLADEFIELFETRGEISLDVMARHALLSTIYKSTHAKAAIDQLVEQRLIVPVAKGRSYSEKTFRLAPPSLF